MLGNLFKEALSSLTPGTPRTTRPNTSVESVQEDIHTRSLLYPDAEALYQHQHDQVFPLASSAVSPLAPNAHAFDISADIELEVKDVRLVVLQEKTALNPTGLLFDSSTPPKPESKEQLHGSQNNRHTATPRRTSLGSQPMVTVTEPPRVGGGGFGRRPSHARAASFAETDDQKATREYKEEIESYAACMFGSSDIMAFKGTGTKVHIMPADARSTSSFTDVQGSLGRSSLRSSRLAQSYTSESIMSAPTSTTLPRALEKKKVLITRIFPVPLASPETTAGRDQYPFPVVDSDGAVNKEDREQPRQRRTPMYAIGLIINLPVLHGSALRSAFRPSSFTEQESFPSSYSSLKPAGWTVLGDGFGVESLDSSIMSDADDRIDIITQHWDIIVRTLSQLQASASFRIHTLLKQVDIASPLPKPRAKNANISVAGKRVEDLRPKKAPTSNAKLVQLPPGALARDKMLKVEADSARFRIVMGIKTLQVVTRQGRWGIWRDEARWVAKWSGSRETGFFFYNLLTAFLGTHTDWLQALAPQSYRRRHYQLSRSGKEGDQPLSARTIIIANDKMAARRLIFLLSAFLVPNQQQQLPYTRTYRPSTATSFGGYSQSPPSFITNREEPLRRKVNRRKHVHNRTMSFPSQPVPERPRRNSDANLKTANLPIPGSEGSSRKTSAATTTTVTPVTSMPHFSTRQRAVIGTGPIPRPGSSGSLATEDLMRTLKRGDSTGQYSNASSDSQSGSRWGSVTSWGGKMGFWSKRRDSTSATDFTVEEEPQKGKLAEMVEEARATSEVAPEQPLVKYEIPEPPIQEHTQPLPYVSPIKSTVNEDGIIDIEVQLPDFLSNFGSVLSSPSSSGYLSGMGPGLEGFEHFTRSGDADAPLNVGGWLPRYHPDFTLQGVPAQDGLEEEIKASMRAEPTPVLMRDEESRWVDVSTALIADTTKFTVKRIRYRRFIKAVSTADMESSVSSAQGQPQSSSIYGNPYSGMEGHLSPASDAKLEDQFIEDYVATIDEGLIDAVERAIAQPTAVSVSGGTSTSSQHKGGDSSRASSRSGRVAHGKGRARSNSNETQTDKERQNIPRGECKKCILGALETIAKNVVDARVEEPKKEGVSNSVLREGVAAWLTALDEA